MYYQSITSIMRDGGGNTFYEKMPFGLIDCLIYGLVTGSVCGCYFHLIQFQTQKSKQYERMFCKSGRNFRQKESGNN